jgi:hypothetical protein
LFGKNIKKTPDKINNGILSLRQKFVSPTGNRARRKIALAAICSLIILVFCAFTAAIESNNIIVRASSVNGLGVGIYWDQACTNKTLSFDWGNIEPGSNNSVTIYIMNEVSSPASMSLETTNWTPSASLDVISLNWNYSGQVISSGQVIPIDLTLTVLPDINNITSFSFTTIITANER